MIVMASRTFFSKVRPRDQIVFKPCSGDGDENGSEGSSSADGTGGNLSRSNRSFATKVKTGLKEDHSMFAWANKGHWESVESLDPEVTRERDWFRIGFEPLFVDFTKNGAWFVVYTLVEVSKLSMVSLRRVCSFVVVVLLGWPSAL